MSWRMNRSRLTKASLIWSLYPTFCGMIAGVSMTFVESAPLLTRAEILAHSDLIPQSRGAYAWLFRNPPPGVPTDGCYVRDGLTLLYVGISPKNERSRQLSANGSSII